MTELDAVRGQINDITDIIDVTVASSSLDESIKNSIRSWFTILVFSLATNNKVTVDNFDDFYSKNQTLMN